MIRLIRVRYNGVTVYVRNRGQKLESRLAKFGMGTFYSTFGHSIIRLTPGECLGGTFLCVCKTFSLNVVVVRMSVVKKLFLTPTQTDDDEKEFCARLKSSSRPFLTQFKNILRLWLEKGKSRDRERERL